MYMMNQWEVMKMGENEKPGGKTNFPCGGSTCRLVPKEKGVNYYTENKPDPYVIRARERAKSKLRDRMVGINGGKA